MDIKTVSIFLLSLCVTITQQKIYNCDPKASCGCSLNSALVNARIINGETASTKTWLWAASLRVGDHVCGGSIISDLYIMTAAHCVEGRSIYQITVYLGSIGLLQGYIHQVSHIYIHPLYYMDPSEAYVLHDIALLKLSTPLNMNDTILAKVCLPKCNTVVATNTDLVAIGWRTIYEDNEHASETLRQVTLDAIDSNSHWCRSVARNTTIQFCAGIMPSGGKDTCQGDSGGPLMMFNEDKQWEVQGIVSYGDGCGRSSKPGVYTRVGYYLDWINEIVRGDPASTKANIWSKATSSRSNLLLAYFIAFFITFN